MTAYSEYEVDLLGVAMLDPRVTAAVKLDASQFEHPARGAVWQAIRDIHTDGNTPTPTLVLEKAQATGIVVDPALLVSLVGRGVASNLELYASRVADGAVRRGIATGLIKAKQMLEEGLPTDEVVSAASMSMNVTTQAEDDTEDMLSLDEFVDRDLGPEEWVIPGLFAKGDRAVVTGGEGLGKSVLIRQMAVCAAAGVHPFNFSDIPPVRTLLVDVENPERIMIKVLGQMRNSMTNRGKPTEDRMWVKRLPQGMDLAQTRDRMLLHNLCMVTNPDLLVIGPAYKLYTGSAGKSEEDIAKTITKTLDGLREEFGFALILEHHSPHGSAGYERTVRPIGSSLWMRWPEFGFGLVPEDGHTPSHRHVRIKHWRGQRDDRPWPQTLESGSVLPWIDANPADTTSRY